MVFIFFIGLGVVAFVGTLLWRRKISNAQNNFKTKVELASDEEHAKRLHQQYLKKQR